MNVENILFFCSLRWHFYVCEKKIQSEEFQNFNLRSEKNFFIKFYQTLQQHIAIVFLSVLSRQMASMTPTHKLYSHPHAEENVFPFPTIEFCVCDNTHASVKAQGLNEKLHLSAFLSHYAMMMMMIRQC